MSDWTTVHLHCINDRLYLSSDASLGVVWTADGWQIVNAATGERIEEGVLHDSPEQAAGAITRMIRGGLL
jgi:hypothetical protein